MPDQPPRLLRLLLEPRPPALRRWFGPPTRICGFCAALAVAQTTPPCSTQPLPEQPSKELRLASIPTPKTLVAHFGQTVAKRRLALGVSNHFTRLVDTCDRDAPDPTVTDLDLRDVVVEKSGKPLWLPTSTSLSPSGMPRA